MMHVHVAPFFLFAKKDYR